MTQIFSRADRIEISRYPRLPQGTAGGVDFRHSRQESFVLCRWANRRGKAPVDPVKRSPAGVSLSHSQRTRLY
jgi:hypothetical protein